MNHSKAILAADPVSFSLVFRVFSRNLPRGRGRFLHFNLRGWRRYELEVDVFRLIKRAIKMGLADLAILLLILAFSNEPGS